MFMVMKITQSLNSTGQELLKKTVLSVSSSKAGAVKVYSCESVHSHSLKGDYHHGPDLAFAVRGTPKAITN